MSDRVAIIGGGLGGLAAAITLAGRGYPVTLFEKKSTLEENFVLEKDGFRFDIGPTFLTMPRVLDRIFREANRRLFDHVQLAPLDPHYRCFFVDGTYCDFHANVEQMIAQFGDGYRRFLKKCDRMAYLADKYLFWRSVGGWKGVLSFTSIPELLPLILNRSYSKAVRSFVDERAAQVIEAPWRCAGLPPSWKLSLTHFQAADGAWHPAGGIAAIPKALIHLAHELGIECRLGLAIAPDDQTSFRGVISTHDMPSTSEVVEVTFHLGISQGYPHLRLHNFLMSQTNTTYYVHASSPTTLTISVHVARKRALSTTMLRTAILKALATTGRMFDIESRIRCESMQLRDTARPSRFYSPNRSATQPGHYFAGHNAHPGPGFAMELMSGWIAADSLDQDAFQAGTKPLRSIADVPY